METYTFLKGRQYNKLCSLKKFNFSNMTKKVRRRECIYIYTVAEPKIWVGGRLIERLKVKKLININNKIYKKLYNNIIIIHNLI